MEGEETWRLDLTDQILAFLLEAFPDAPVDQLRQAAACSLDYEEAVDFVLALDAPPEQECPRETLLKIFSAYFDKAILNERISQCAEEDLEKLGDSLMTEIGQRASKPRWKKIDVSPVRGQRGMALDSMPAAKVTVESLFGFKEHELKGLEMEDLRTELEACLAKRNETYSRAAFAYRKHNLTGYGQASYLSEEGRRENERAQHLRNQLSALCLLRCNPTFPSCTTLDLHHQTVDSALLILEAFLDTHPHQELRIVTGAGRHSEVGARLRPAIWQKLQHCTRPFTFDGHASFTVYPIRR